MIVIGIDIGTSGCKAVAFDESGAAVGSGYQGYGLIAGAGGRVEQDPEEWRGAMGAAVRRATAELDRTAVGALALSTQGASSFLADGELRPLTRALTWMDTRAAPLLEAIEGELGGDSVYRATGWRPHASLDLAKGRWLAENAPDTLKRARYFVSTLEYANHFLTGRPAIDPTNAAMRQLYDIRAGRWDPALLGCARIDESLLPPVLPSGECLGHLTDEAAEELGLGAGVLVYNGAHDQYCGALGAAILEPGQLMLSAGTAWVIMAVSDRPVYSPSFISPGPHILPGLYGALASLPTAGAALGWLKDNVIGCDYAEINGRAAERIEKCRELFFCPNFAGSGFPDWAGGARACFIGLDLACDRYDLALACMEGAAFRLRMALDEYEACGIGVSAVHVLGGAARSPLWLSVVSAVCGKAMRLVRVQDAPCAGAACIAGVGLGLYGDYRPAAALMGGSAPFEPAPPALAEHYARKYRRFLALSGAVNSMYDRR